MNFKCMYAYRIENINPFIDSSKKIKYFYYKINADLMSYKLVVDGNIKCKK